MRVTSSSAPSEMHRRIMHCSESVAYPNGGGGDSGVRQVWIWGTGVQEAVGYSN